MGGRLQRRFAKRRGIEPCGTEPETATPCPVGAGQFATIGFWQNSNGQAVINSFNGSSTSTALGNWLASNFPNLFGASNPYISANCASMGPRLSPG